MKTLRKTLLLFFALLAFGQISWAQFITDVIVVGADNSDNWHFGAYQNNGWIKKDKDLNDGASGHYIYLFYKTSSSPDNSGTAINDFYLRVSDDPYAPTSLTHLGRTYYRVSADGDSDFINSGGDLNCGASGKFIHLYYTKEGNSPVQCHNIYFNANPYNPCDAVGMNGSTTAADLNLDANGDDIFMHVSKQFASNPAEIYTEGQLHDAVAIASVNPNLKLMSDINLSKGVVIGDIDHGRSNTVTLDLNGYTINRGLTSSTHLGSVIRVEPTSTLTLNDGSDGHTGTITGGRTQQSGGGICNHGTLYVNGCTISGCSAGSYGGGIVCGKLTSYSSYTYYPEMHLNGTTITGCQSTSGGGLGIIDYADDMLVQAYATGCTFSNNVATNEGGGAINFTYLELTNCTFTGNTAVDVGGFYNATNGMAVVTGCTFTNNNGTNGAGALANAINAQTLYLTNNTITGNTAGTRGGGIWNGATINMSGSHTITGNTAVGNGGGIYNGGTLNVEGGTLVVNDNTKGSEANNLYLDSGMTLNVTGAFNAASDIHVSAENLTAPITSGYGTHNASVDPTTLFTADNGRDITLINNEVFQIATLNAEVSTEQELNEALNNADYNLINITLTDNITLAERALIPAGKNVTLDLNGYTLQRGELEGYHWYFMVIHNYGTLTINDSSGTNAGQITGGRAYGGGGIYCEAGSSLTFNGGTITDNMVTTINNGSGFGGGIYINDGAVATINGGVITGNSGPQGGGVYNYGTLTIGGNALISGNTGDDGGGIFNRGTLNITAGSITGNQASTLGGGGISNYGTVNMHGGAVTYNSSTTTGGGIWNGATLTMQGCPVVSGNINTANDTDNVYLNGSTVITVTGAFTQRAEIGVAPSSISNVITSGYNTHNPGTTPYHFFSSDNDFCGISSNGSGEAILRQASGNWWDNRAASYSNVNGNTITITSEAELALMAFNVHDDAYNFGYNYVLGTDLDMSEHYWTPIGNYSHRFMGNFDGNGHTISGICVNRPTEDFNGLFGYVQGIGFSYLGEEQPGCEYIKNFVLKNSFIRGGNNIGGVAGRLEDGLTLENVVCQAEVTGGNDVGGLVGRAKAPDAIHRIYTRSCLFLSGKVTGTGNHAAVIGTIEDYVNRTNLYYVAPTSDVGNTTDVRAYPIIETLPEGVTLSYGAGVSYNGIHYHPAGTVNLTVRYDLNQVVTVEMIGDELVGSDGHYSFTIDPAVTETYVISATVSPSPVAGSGTEALPYLIASQEQWNYVADYLNGGHSSNNLSGAHLRLAADDITISQKMMGNASQPFRGIFDGDGRTLTLAFGSSDNYSDQECAPFYRLDNATIKNLVVAGSIYSSAQHNGGIAARAMGSNNRIQNCVSNVSIHSNRSGSGDAADCTNGGFIGLVNINDAHVYFEGCAFTGQLLGENASNWGGFVGWREYTNSTKSYVHFTDCLFAPTTVNIATPDGSNSRPFCRSYNSDGAEYTNCYYTNALQGDFGGKKAYSITGDSNVIVDNAGTPSSSTTTGVIGYGTGIKYNDVLYAGNGEEVSLTLTGNTQPGYSCGSYSASAGTLTGEENPYTLSMPDADVTISSTLTPVDWASVSAGTANDPYRIYNPDQLNMLAQRVHSGNNYHGKYFKLMNDLHYSHTTDWDDATSTENNFTSIGGHGWHFFNGDFDGDGHTISGIRIYIEGKGDYDVRYGLFGLVGGGGNIHGITLADTRITGYSDTGGIVGQITDGGNLTDCHVADDVAIHAIWSTAYFHGGIVGTVTQSTVSHCTSAATLTLTPGENIPKSFGAICGYNYQGTLSDNLVIGATVPAAWHNEYGAIVGTNGGTLARNYYVNCTVAGTQNATNVGCGGNYDTPPSDSKTNDGAVPGNARTITGYGESVTDGWAFIASPLTDGTDPALVENLISNTSEYDLYRLNPSTVKWENWKIGAGNNAASGFSLDNGRGYLYATQTEQTVKFIGADASAYNLNDTTEVNLQKGFNLVGNPFLRAAWVNRSSYYTLNQEGSAIEPEAVSSTVAISPCYGVIVEATGDSETVTFTTTAPVMSGSANNGNIQVALAQTVTTRGGAETKTIDNAIVSFNEGSELGKFYFGEQSANIYLPQNGKEYAIAFSEGVGEMPLNFKAKENGTYTLTVSPSLNSKFLILNYLHLIDNLTGNDVDLLTQPSYTFTAKTSDYPSRFRLVFIAQQDGEASDDSFAFLSNGKIIINGEGTLQVIDALGRIVKSEQLSTLNSQLPTSNFTPGVYVLRLIDGENVRTQKIIIK